MQRTKSPRRLWDFCTCYVAEIRRLTAQPLYSLHGRTSYELVTGDTPDISEYVEFEWYQPIWYYEANAFPEERRKLGRWIGVAHRIGQAMCYWIIPESGVPIARTTIQMITSDEMATIEVQTSLKAYDEAIQKKIGDQVDEAELPGPMQGMMHPEDEEDDALDHGNFEPFAPSLAMPEADEFDAETFDNYLQAEVLLPKGDNLVTGMVTGRKRDADGNPVGRRNTNPILDSRVYEVEFPDGHVEEYAANVIAECIYSQVDDEGNQFLLLNEIIDHKRDESALQWKDMWITGKNGNKHMKRTTKGWKLCVTWKDGSSSWEPLKDLKESNPLQVAEYAISNNINDEPAFAWWVDEALKCRDRMISAARSRYWKRTHKFGIRIPKTTEEALAIDLETGTDFWRKAIEKEMTNVKPAFKILEEGGKAPIGYKWIPCHMIFDVKMDFTRKARFVAGGHVTDPPTSITYSSVVSRDSVRIAFLIAALNDLEVLGADVGNAYLNAEMKEKVYTTAGKEFGKYAGRTVIIIRALYGLKSSGAAWRAHLSQTLQDLEFKSSLADPDVWYKRATKPDGFQYYEYILIYVDDILVLSHQPKLTMNALGALYCLKEGSVGIPDHYLGATVKQWRFPDDATKVRWGLCSEQYVAEAIRNVEAELQAKKLKLPSKTSTPLSSGYRPELDVSPLLNDEETNYYQNLIGILRWAVKLGCIDIHVHVAMMSRYLVQPRSGHMLELYHIFAYLKSHKRSTMVFDDARVDIDESRFTIHDWQEFYHDAKELIPPNAPEPRGNPVQMNCFVDSDHAGNRVTHHSHTGILIFLNRAPIVWFSKAQNTVEMSTFGSKFVAMRIAVELIESLRYKLRMFGIPLEGSTNVFCDNQSVVTSASVPELTLKKKHNSIAYHRVRECVAAGTIRIIKEPSETNLADMLTKPLPGRSLM